MPPQSEMVTSHRYPAPITDILDAQDAGRAAAFSNAPLTTCPYRGDDDMVAFMRRMWLRGYIDGRDELATQYTTTGT